MRDATGGISGGKVPSGGNGGVDGGGERGVGRGDAGLAEALLVLADPEAVLRSLEITPEIGRD